MEEYTTLYARSVARDYIRCFGDMLVTDGLLHCVFYDNYPSTSDEFQTWSTANGQDLRFIENSRGDMCGMYWLNNCLGKTAMIHFCYLKNYFYDQENIGLYVVRGLLNARSIKPLSDNRMEDGDLKFDLEKDRADKTSGNGDMFGSAGEEFVLSALFGLTPKIYRHVFPFLDKLGFRRQLVVPQSCYFAKRERYVDGVLSMLTRETMA